MGPDDIQFREARQCDGSRHRFGQAPASSPVEHLGGGGVEGGLAAGGIDSAPIYSASTSSSQMRRLPSSLQQGDLILEHSKRQSGWRVTRDEEPSSI